MKHWTITGEFDNEDFAADLVVDADGDVISAEWPIAELIGMRWTDARSYCVDRGYHGQPHQAQMIEGNSALRRRGWSDSQIKKYLDEPDELRPNPHYPGGQPMKCYLLSRVQLIEQEYAIGNRKESKISA